MSFGWQWLALNLLAMTRNGGGGSGLHAGLFSNATLISLILFGWFACRP